MEILQNNIKRFGTKVDQLSESAKDMKEEERIQKLVNN
jgi:hypothetical protein